MKEAKIKPTENQELLVRSIIENQLSVIEGPAGSGKTLWSLITSINQLKQGNFEQILLTRPLVSVGKEFPSLPGNVDEKIQPYMLTFFEYLKELINGDLKLRSKILIRPLELMRGHTYHNTILILDEVQNAFPKQVKMFISRAGKNSKVIISGDKTQSDIKYTNGLEFCLNNLKGVEHCNIVNLGYQDIMRNTELAHVIKIFDECGIN